MGSGRTIIVEGKSGLALVPRRNSKKNSHQGLLALARAGAGAQSLVFFFFSLSLVLFDPLFYFLVPLRFCVCLFLKICGDACWLLHRLDRLGDGGMGGGMWERMWSHAATRREEWLYVLAGWLSAG